MGLFYLLCNCIFFLIQLLWTLVMTENQIWCYSTPVNFSVIIRSQGFLASEGENGPGISLHYERATSQWLGGKESACYSRRHRFNPWVGKISRRRKWQPTPDFLPGKSHGQRRLMGYSPWGSKESDMTEVT